jgi:hypothetical protein
MLKRLIKQIFCGMPAPAIPGHAINSQQAHPGTLSVPMAWGGILYPGNAGCPPFCGSFSSAYI